MDNKVRVVELGPGRQKVGRRHRRHRRHHRMPPLPGAQCAAFCAAAAPQAAVTPADDGCLPLEFALSYQHTAAALCLLAAEGQPLMCCGSCMTRDPQRCPFMLTV